MNLNSSKLDCNTVEKILFQNSINELNKFEKDQILQHIESCDNCRASEKLIKSFSQLLQAELVNSKLNPNPVIKESLLNRLISQSVFNNSILEFVRNFFKLRIPLYQVITALILIGAFTFFFNQKGNRLDSLSNNVAIIAAIDSNAISMSFQNSIEWIDNHNKGKSILEDSVLASFIQSAM
jgi:hypothetical protein